MTCLLEDRRKHDLTPGLEVIMNTFDINTHLHKFVLSRPTCMVSKYFSLYFNCNVFHYIS